MSFATDALKQILNSEDTTRADYAQSCGMHVTNLYDILNGKVPISTRNIGKLLGALPQRDQKRRLLIAYLQDAVPPDMEGEISIIAGAPPLMMLAEGETPYGKPDTTTQLVQRFAALSPETQDQILRLVMTIQRDDELRAAFTALMHYAIRDIAPLPTAPDTTAAAAAAGRQASYLITQAKAELRRKDRERQTAPPPTHIGHKPPQIPR